MTTRYLRTSDVAKAVGVHPNTVRLYEAWGFLPPIPRSASGYRLFNTAHLDQMRLARTALCGPYPGGKSLVVDLVQRAALGDLGGALELAYVYLARVRAEQAQAEAAAELLERWAQGTAADATAQLLLIGEAAELLGASRDMLRNWERNGLIKVPRDPRNGYRLYGAAEIGRLRVIRTLSRAGYSMMAILRMLLHLDEGRGGDLRQVLDTPRPDEDACYATDRWLSTLAGLEQRALDVIAQLEEMMRQRQE
jgi:DNA-binding transcriptional MerR regulator